MTEPVAYFYASIAGPVVLHRLKQIGVAKPLFNQRAVDDDLKAAEDWPNAHSMTPLYTKQEWQRLTDDELREMLGYGKGGYIAEYTRNFVDAIEAKLKEKNGG
jgi:hypothetical protein